MEMNRKRSLPSYLKFAHSERPAFPDVTGRAQKTKTHLAKPYRTQPPVCSPCQHG